MNSALKLPSKHLSNLAVIVNSSTALMTQYQPTHTVQPNPRRPQKQKKERKTQHARPRTSHCIAGPLPSRAARSTAHVSAARAKRLLQVAFLAADDDRWSRGLQEQLPSEASSPRLCSPWVVDQCAPRGCRASASAAESCMLGRSDALTWLDSTRLGWIRKGEGEVSRESAIVVVAVGLGRGAEV